MRPLYLLLILLAAPLSAEETGWFRLGDPDLLKADLTDLQLYLDGDAIADPGVVLEEATTGEGAGLDYRFTSLPDVAAGDDETYSLTWSYDLVGYSYIWPSRTRTALAVLTYTISTSPIQLTQGSTIPGVGLTIRGLPEDPTGSTVVFNLWRTQGNVRVLTDQAAEVVSSGVEAGGTWQAVVEYDWTAAQTAVLSGDHYGRFKVTLPSAAVVWVPPPPGQLGVRIHALP